jgi:putative oxidoreductase
MFRRLIATSPNWATIPLRIVLGVIFFAHGAQKVLGSFEGPGLANFTGAPAPFNFMRPSWFWMGAAAFSEFVGGILILLGLLTRVGAFFIACVMLTAIAGVHWPNFFANKRGFEYPLALFAIVLSLLISGGGSLSVDQAMGGKRRK